MAEPYKVKVDVKNLKDRGFDALNIRTQNDPGVAVAQRYLKAEDLTGGTMGAQGRINIGSKELVMDGKDRRLLVNDGADNRVMMGRRKDGTYGFDVSQPGEDVDTPGIDGGNLVMSSNFNSLKIVTTGTLQVTDGAGTSDQATYSHGLGYVPGFLCYWNAGAGTLEQMPNAIDSTVAGGGNVEFQTWAWAVATSTSFIINVFHANAGGPWNFTYYLLRETAAVTLPLAVLLLFELILKNLKLNIFNHSDSITNMVHNYYGFRDYLPQTAGSVGDEAIGYSTLFQMPYPAIWPFFDSKPFSREVEPVHDRLFWENEGLRGSGRWGATSPVHRTASMRENMGSDDAMVFENAIDDIKNAPTDYMTRKGIGREYLEMPFIADNQRNKDLMLSIISGKYLY